MDVRDISANPLLQDSPQATLKMLFRILWSGTIEKVDTSSAIPSFADSRGGHEDKPQAKAD